MTETKIPHMENIKKTAELFGLPVHFVRCKVSSGEVVAVRAGRRFLVNVDKFAEYLNSSHVQPAGRAPSESGTESGTSRVLPIR